MSQAAGYGSPVTVKVTGILATGFAVHVPEGALRPLAPHGRGKFPARALKAVRALAYLRCAEYDR